MSGHLIMFLVGGIAGAVAGLAAGIQDGKDMGRAEIMQDAVRHGAANWFDTPSGERVFLWVSDGALRHAPEREAEGE